jgi:hypothetical protein
VGYPAGPNIAPAGFLRARPPPLAALFHRSNWTQEQLAKKEGKAQSWIARRLLFGRFLSFMPTGINAENVPTNLTERRFRSYWERAPGCGGNEQDFGSGASKVLHTVAGCQVLAFRMASS